MSLDVEDLCEDREAIEHALYSLLHYDPPSTTGQVYGTDAEAEVTKFSSHDNFANANVLRSKCEEQQPHVHPTVQNATSDENLDESDSIVFAKLSRSSKPKKRSEDVKLVNANGKRTKKKFVEKQKMKPSDGDVLPEMEEITSQKNIFPSEDISDNGNMELNKGARKRVMKNESKAGKKKRKKKKLYDESLDEAKTNITPSVPLNETKRKKTKTKKSKMKETRKTATETKETVDHSELPDIICLDSDSQDESRNLDKSIADNAVEKNSGDEYGPTSKTKGKKKKKKETVGAVKKKIEKQLQMQGFAIDKTHDAKLSLNKILKKETRLEKFKQKVKKQTQKKMARKAEKKRLKDLQRGVDMEITVKNDFQNSRLTYNQSASSKSHLHRLMLQNHQSISAKENNSVNINSKVGLPQEKSPSDSVNMSTKLVLPQKNSSTKVSGVKNVSPSRSKNLNESVVVISDLSSDDEKSEAADAIVVESSDTESDHSLIMAGVLSDGKPDGVSESNENELLLNMQLPKKNLLGFSSDEYLKKILSSIGDCDWRVSQSDLFPPSNKERYFGCPKVRCRNCNEWGHYAKSCPKPKKVMKCLVCGCPGHTMNACMFQQCFNCQVFGHLSKDCHLPRKSSFMLCQRCGLTGHGYQVCPERWRQFHSMTDFEKGYKSSQNKVHARGAQRSCCNCGKMGHSDLECKEARMNKFSKAANLFIKTYEIPRELRSLGVKANPVITFHNQKKKGTDNSTRYSEPVPQKEVGCTQQNQKAAIQSGSKGQYSEQNHGFDKSSIQAEKNLERKDRKASPVRRNGLNQQRKKSDAKSRTNLKRKSCDIYQ